MSISGSQFSVQGGATPLTKGEGQAFARRILNSTAYRADLEQRAASGKLAPAMEIALWHYAYGKPVEHVSINVAPGTEDLQSLPIDELYRRAEAIALQVKEAMELAEAIPPEIMYGSPGSSSSNFDPTVTH